MVRRSATTLILAIIFAAPSLATAANSFVQLVPQNCSGAGAAENCGFCDLAQLAQNVLNDAVYLAVFISAVFFAWAGFLMLTNTGDTHKVSEARKIFTDVAIGLVIILAAWLVVDTLMRIMVGGQVGGLPWNRVCR